MPGEFIDEKVPDFEISAWVNAVKNAPQNTSIFSSDFSEEKMVQETLNWLSNGRVENV